jgi:hypothetical protein
MSEFEQLPCQSARLVRIVEVDGQAPEHSLFEAVMLFERVCRVSERPGRGHARQKDAADRVGLGLTVFVAPAVAGGQKLHPPVPCRAFALIADVGRHDLGVDVVEDLAVVEQPGQVLGEPHHVQVHLSGDAVHAGILAERSRVHHCMLRPEKLIGRAGRERETCVPVHPRGGFEELQHAMTAVDGLRVSGQGLRVKELVARRG